jgi:hypothetical protein
MPWRASRWADAIAVAGAIVEQSTTMLPGCQVITGAICPEQHGLHGCVVADANQQNVHALGDLGGRGAGDAPLQAWIALGAAASGVNAEGDVSTLEVGGHGKAQGAEADHPHPQVTSGHGWWVLSSEFRGLTRQSAFSWIVSA